MHKDVEEYYRKYFCRAASGWADHITPDMYSTIVSVLGISRFPPPVVAVGKPAFVNTGEHDVNTVAEYIDNPNECTENPYTYHAMKHIKELDLKWIDTVIQKRTRNYGKIYGDLRDGARELDHPRSCFSMNDLVRLANLNIEKYPEALIKGINAR